MSPEAVAAELQLTHGELAGVLEAWRRNPPHLRVVSRPEPFEVSYAEGRLRAVVGAPRLDVFGGESWRGPVDLLVDVSAHAPARGTGALHLAVVLRAAPHAGAPGVCAAATCLASSPVPRLVWRRTSIEVHLPVAISDDNGIVLTIAGGPQFACLPAGPIDALLCQLMLPAAQAMLSLAQAAFRAEVQSALQSLAVGRPPGLDLGPVILQRIAVRQEGISLRFRLRQP